MTPGGALCSLHPETPAAAACARCGRFACSACLLPGAEPWCLECDRDRFGEWTRGPHSLAVVFQQGLQLFGKNAHIALALAALAGASETLIALSDLVALPFVQLAVQLTMSGFGTAAFLLCLHETVQGRTPVAAEVIGNAVGALPRVVFAMVLYTLLVGVGLLAAIVPGIMLLAQLSLCEVVAVLDRGQGPIRTSFSMLHRKLGTPLLVQAIAWTGYAAFSVGTYVLSSAFGHSPPLFAGLSFAGGISRHLVTSAADAMLFVIWLRLRHPQQHSVA